MIFIIIIGCTRKCSYSQSVCFTIPSSLSSASSSTTTTTTTTTCPKPFWPSDARRKPLGICVRSSVSFNAAWPTRGSPRLGADRATVHLDSGRTVSVKTCEVQPREFEGIAARDAAFHHQRNFSVSGRARVKNESALLLRLRLLLLFLRPRVILALLLRVLVLLFNR